MYFVELFKKSSLDCRTRSARKEGGAPVSGLQSHTLCGSTVAALLAEDERSARLSVGCGAKHGARRLVTVSAAPRRLPLTTAPARGTLRFLFRILMF
jgi:hypothetical protein